MYDEIFSAVREASLPAIWTRGVELSRSARFVQTSTEGDAVSLKIVADTRPVTPQVTLWPGDRCWSCDCDEANDPCTHVIASVLALRGDRVETAEEAQSNDAARLVYAFERHDGRLLFGRYIVANGSRERLKTSLLGYVGGVSSGRLRGPQIGATKKDFAIDSLIGDLRDGQPDRESWPALFRMLASIATVELDRAPVTVDAEPLTLRLAVEDAGDGVIVRRELSEPADESFKNGIARCGTRLCLVAMPNLNESERRFLAPGGVLLRGGEIVDFAAQILPGISSKIAVERRTARLPDVRPLPLRVVLETEADPDRGDLLVTPRLVYGNDEDEVVVSRGDLVVRSGRIRVVPLRDFDHERRLLRDLRIELDLQPDRTVRLERAQGIAFLRGLDGWSVRGSGLAAYSVEGPLSIEPRLDDRSFAVGAVTGSGKQASFDEVLRAWRAGERYVALDDGGFAEIPVDWFNEHGPRIVELYEARDANGELPRALLPAGASALESAGVPTSDEVRAFIERLLADDERGDVELPLGFCGELRPYQRAGARWMVERLESGLGALLADDMGLGKTVQCAAVLRGRTLIVVPTSVLHSWRDHIERFRPDLRYSLYTGTGRALDDADVTLTTYGIMRMDIDRLLAVEWDCVVLDEAHAIKNAESQTAQAAHRLRSARRIALTGTPVENHLGELWSVFTFLNPGILGTRDRFQERFVQPIARGDERAREELRQRVRPFVLRRTKSQVAPELPPKTQLVVRCELNTDERSLYDALLAATKKEVLALLEQGGSLFSVLEQLLRLRQTCCHRALVPGGGSPSDESSKLSLLFELLECAIDEGHRALVFSQWTSLLDLVEPRLRDRDIAFTRLDGSTPDRGRVVNEFQSPQGPPVMLLSLKAGGTGLTLTAADHVFMLDPWWNPAVEDQAADRAHRIGQDRPVMVYKLIAEETIEERILELQDSKRALLDAVLEGSGAATALTKDDLLRLLDL